MHINRTTHVTRVEINIGEAAQLIKDLTDAVMAAICDDTIKNPTMATIYTDDDFVDHPGTVVFSVVKNK